MSIDRDGGHPPYQQLADILRESIRNGGIPVGKRIPSMTELEAEHELARNTIKKAFDVLKAEGLIETSPGLGMVVVKVPPPAEG